jgi:hypothetical protein
VSAPPRAGAIVGVLIAAGILVGFVALSRLKREAARNTATIEKLGNGRAGDRVASTGNPFTLRQTVALVLM